MSRVFPQSLVELTLLPRSAEVAIPQIGRQIGLDLSTAGEIGRDVVMVHARAVTVDELLHMIADVTYGQWSPAADGWILSRSAKLAEEAASHRIQSEARMLSEALSGFRGMVDLPYTEEFIVSSAPEDPAEIRPRGIRAFTDEDYCEPLVRALGRLLSQLDLATLIEAASEGEAILHSNPKANDVQLRKVTATLKLLYDEQKTYSKARHLLPGAPLSDTRSKVLFRPVAAELRFALLSPSYYICHLIIKNWAGQQIAEYRSTFHLVDPCPHAPIEAAEDRANLRPESRALFGDVGEVLNKPDGEWLADWLLDPVLNDPLSAGISEALEAAANARGLALVANLPDSTSDLSYDVQDDHVLGTTILNSLSQRSDVCVSTEGRWLCIAPADPLQAGRRRLDRHTLKRVLRRSRNPGAVTAEDRASLACATVDASSVPDLFWFLMYATPPLLGARIDEGWLTYRLWGTLGEDKRQALLSGESFSIESLVPQAREVIRRMVSYFPLRSLPGRRENKGGPLQIACRPCPVRVALLFDAADPSREPYVVLVVDTYQRSVLSFGQWARVKLPGRGLAGTLCQIEHWKRVELIVDFSKSWSGQFGITLGGPDIEGSPLPYSELDADLRAKIRSELQHRLLLSHQSL